MGRGRARWGRADSLQEAAVPGPAISVLGGPAVGAPVLLLTPVSPCPSNGHFAALEQGGAADPSQGLQAC